MRIALRAIGSVSDNLSFGKFSVRYLNLMLNILIFFSQLKCLNFNLFLVAIQLSHYLYTYTLQETTIKIIERQPIFIIVCRKKENFGHKLSKSMQCKEIYYILSVSVSIFKFITNNVLFDLNFVNSCEVGCSYSISRQELNNCNFCNQFRSGYFVRYY